MTAGGGSGHFTRAGYIICSACQTENRATNRFCERCGTRLGVSTRAPVRKPELEASQPRLPDPASASIGARPDSPSSNTPERTNVSSSGGPTHSAAPPPIHLGPPGTGGEGESPAHAAGSRAALADAGAGAPTQAEVTTGPTAAGASRPARRDGAPRTAVASGASSQYDGSPSLATPNSAPYGNHTRALMLGLAGALLLLCLVLWLLLAFLGAINFSARGAAFATGVATIVATRAP